jgi:hypothetical protein
VKSKSFLTCSRSVGTPKFLLLWLAERDRDESLFLRGTETYSVRFTVPLQHIRVHAHTRCSYWETFVRLRKCSVVIKYRDELQISESPLLSSQKGEGFSLRQVVQLFVSELLGEDHSPVSQSLFYGVLPGVRSRASVSLPQGAPENAPSLSLGGVFRPLCLRLLHEIGALISLRSRVTGQTGRRSRRAGS